LLPGVRKKIPYSNCFASLREKGADEWRIPQEDIEEPERVSREGEERLAMSKTCRILPENQIIDRNCSERCRTIPHDSQILVVLCHS
jgi:hypothetical protein